MAAARVDNYMDPLNRDAAATAVPDGDDAPAARHALTTEDADRIRAELLALMAPFPPSR